MAYDEQLASRVRQAVGRTTKHVEKAMFGGLAFLVKGHMACGVIQDRVVVRLSPETVARRSSEPGASPMTFTGRPMKGFLYVSGAGVATPRALAGWIDDAVRHAASLPPKRGGKNRKARRNGRNRR